ncbi:MAG: carboxypeptidase regulatory-like domain-containing protein [Bacteroidales bacterium]|nr:carboxypeptidase regulatory-like domain-containing protein [Bacteroidales bacterium]
MKTIAKSIILIAVMLLYGSCSKIVQESPETITISGHITDEDGQPVENVSIDLMYITRMNLLGFYYGTGIHAKTDENGYYSIQFDNNDYYSYRLDIEKAGYHYVQSYSVDRWIASQEHDVVMRKKEEYVDLGLPSRTMWANCNVGTNKPEGIGDYFAWGEVAPKSTYSWENYIHCNGAGDQLTKYCNNPAYGYNHFTDALTILDRPDDAGWCNFDSNQGPQIPSKEQWQELYQNTTHTWTTLNGVAGIRFEASNGNSIFLPAGGMRHDDGNTVSVEHGYYWLNSFDTGNPTNAWNFMIGADLDVIGNSTATAERYIGFSVRPVHPYGWPFCPTN